MMKVTILDGSPANDIFSERIRPILITELESLGCDVEHVAIREKKIGNCAGDFFCWIRNPGICHINDDNRGIAETLANSDLLVYLTPVTFGGYSSVLKRMVDHQIQNVLPHFIKIDGEIHHRERYSENPDLLVIGWMKTPDTRAEATFRYLAKRNAINFHAEHVISEIFFPGQSDQDITASINNSLKELQSNQPEQVLSLPRGNGITLPASEVQRAILLVGSPKNTKSTSNSLGEYLFEQLSKRDIETETAYIHTIINSPERIRALLEKIDSADLITLAFPIYVDSLPAPVIELLEQIAAYRLSREYTHKPLLTAISNCGFPEAKQNTTALAICEIFSREAEFQWAGSLALGGGGMIHGESLTKIGGRAARVRKSLEMAASALAQGQAIPSEAQKLMAKPVIPHWLYRFFGDYGWKQQAKRYGVQKSLKRQPYLTKNEN